MNFQFSKFFNSNYIQYNNKIDYVSRYMYMIGIEKLGKNVYILTIFIYKKN